MEVQGVVVQRGGAQQLKAPTITTLLPINQEPLLIEPVRVVLAANCMSATGGGSTCHTPKKGLQRDVILGTDGVQYFEAHVPHGT